MELSRGASESSKGQDPPKSIPEVIRNLLNDPTFSDVKVLVGEEKELFNLHRNIVSARSEFFRNALKAHFKEGTEREISLPEISPDVFKICLGWIYGDDLSFNDDIDMLPELFQAADYLQLKAVKTSLIDYVTEKLGYLDDPYVQVARIAAALPASDYHMMKTWTDVLVRSHPLPEETLWDMLKNPPDDTDLPPLLMMMCLSFEKYINSTFCNTCQRYVQKNPNLKRCAMCKTPIF